MSEQPENHLPPPAALFQIISGFWISRAVYILAKLGIPDLLNGTTKSIDELATATNTHVESLFRVLRALVSVGLLESPAPNQYGLTPVSDLLRTNAPWSLRWFAISELGEEHYPAWGNLMHSVKTGEIAFNDHFGM